MEGESFWTTLPGVLTALGGVLTAAATLVGALYSAGVLGRKRAGASPTATATASPEPVSAPAADSPRSPARVERLRATPSILSGKDLKAELVRLGFHDAWMNPAGRGVAHDYESQVVGSEVLVLDHATGLMWQQSGSADPCVFADAEAYVAGLNRDRLAGYADWRLPTAAEVSSLIEPAEHDGFHIAPVFQRGVNFVWTSDRHPEDGIWIAYFHDARLIRESQEFNAWVRVVRAVEPTVHAGIR